MHQDDEPASTGHKLRWSRRLWPIRSFSRGGRHRFHWSSEDTLAVIITAIGVLVMFMVLLRP